MSEDRSDSSSGAKSGNPEQLCSYIRINTLHALTIVVLGFLSLCGFFWVEFKELEKEVKEVSIIARSAFGSRADRLVEEEVRRNATNGQNSE